jgi:hypothetical protein
VILPPDKIAFVFAPSKVATLDKEVVGYYSTTTLSITTISIASLSITTFSIAQHYDI